MARKKAAPKKSIGYPLEVAFSDDGYKLVWDAGVRLSAFEHRLFCDYLRDRRTSLVTFGAVPAAHLSACAPSLKLLHSVASDYLRRASSCETEDELHSAADTCIAEIMPLLGDTSKITSQSLRSIYSIMSGSMVGSDKGIRGFIDTVYKKATAAYSVSFAVEETPESDKAPFCLHVTCRYDNRDMPLHEAAALFNDDSALDMLTSSVSALARKSSLISRLYSGGRFSDTFYMTEDDMYTFLKETETYSLAGIICKVPNRWKKHRSSISLNLGRRVPKLGADSILSFDINLAIDGEELTPEEIEALVSSHDALFMFRGKWVELSVREMRSALAAYESLRDTGGISLAEAMRAFLSPETTVDTDYEYEVPDIRFDYAEWISKLTEYDFSQLYDVTVPSECFTATLRPYQADGVRWINLMRRMGIGACLSDDMGLGKTLQAIAVLEQIRHEGGGYSLIVIPASLLQNWQNEILRFAPQLKFRVLHSTFGDMRIRPDEDTNVFITTYSMLPRLTQLKSIEWECLILDEAQAIKNPQTQQSRASKGLKAKFRLAMTGTPIENSITDLWSIFDFLNPALFHHSLDMLTSMTDEGGISERLKNFVRPFILRRLKTDKSIISDLPEKIEMKSYCSLTQRQAVLYKQITSMLGDEITYMHGMERRGLVLSGILRLKQICNHPDQYTGNGAYQLMESGKFMRLAEICEDIKQRHERVLVFTQFKEMCEPLSNVLRDVFGQDGLIIHGSTSVAQRGQIVERFNNPDEYVPYIVLSLRAGGVGLNLTAANHVIHFDRWWNPAVENQATDRAFRIGQTMNVIVHKLICTGTLEEKIDRLIESKSAMAADIVESDVKLTELSDAELLALLHMEE